MSETSVTGGCPAPRRRTVVITGPRVSSWVGAPAPRTLSNDLGPGAPSLAGPRPRPAERIDREWQAPRPWPGPPEQDLHQATPHAQAEAAQGGEVGADRRSGR